MRTLSCRISDRPNVATIDKRGDAADGLDHHALDQRAEDEADQRRDDKAEPEVSGRLQREPGEHGADHEEVAVRDIDDVEQAENDREAERDQGDDQPPDQPVQCRAKTAYPSCHGAIVRARHRRISRRLERAFVPVDAAHATRGDSR